MALDGRVVVVTGATGGLGRAAARVFAERGASVVVVGTSRERLDALVAELGLAPGRTLAHAADLRDPAAAPGLAGAAIERFGRADVLLHLVGGWVGGKELAEAEAADRGEMLDQHVWTTWHLLRAFVPRLVAGGRGRVVVVSSPVVTHPTAKSGPYAAAKAAEEALVLGVGQETKGRGVTANVVQVRAIDEEHTRPAGSSAATPEEIVAAMLYLCSDEAARVTSSRLPLTGG
jgi:NAD(P)-dependent dehydrogenase (short-subunit alcohol dehydrogenase family)